MTVTKTDDVGEMQNPAYWEDTPGEMLPPVRNPRAVVSVSFPQEDFRLVSEYARNHGMRTSEFIRSAAIEHARRPEPRATIVSLSIGAALPYRDTAAPMLRLVQERTKSAGRTPVTA